MGSQGRRPVLLWASTHSRGRLTALLQHAGHTVVSLPPEDRLEDVADRLRPVLAVLDLDAAPPGVVQSHARRLGNERHTPFVIVGSGLTIEDRLAAFDLGADDVFDLTGSAEELQARVAVVHRHAGGSGGVELFEDVRLDTAAHVVTRGDTMLELTSLEFALLSTLLRHRGKVLSKAQLIGSVWGHNDVSDNSVEVHICALRKKLELAGPRIVHTVRGRGYVVRRSVPADARAAG